MQTGAIDGLEADGSWDAPSGVETHCVPLECSGGRRRQLAVRC